MLYGRVSHPVLLHFDIHIVVLQPQLCRNIAGLGFFHFARHYSGNHYYFLFLCLLRCFSSAGLRYCDYPSDSQVSPFRNHRIYSYLLIPGAYRSLSRLSSPLRAKASPVYPFLLSSTHTPFAPYGMSFFDSCCILQNQEPRFRIQDRSLYPLFLFLESSESQQSSILLFSLSIYFFQYVKERFASQKQEPRDKIQDFHLVS